MSDHTGEAGPASRPDSWRDRLNDAYYGRMGAEFGERTRARIHWMCSQVRGRSVLDAGCSQGIASILLAREGFKVLGIDSNPDAIACANRERDDEPEPIRERLYFRCIDLISFGEGTFDNILLGEVIEHHVQPARLIEAAARCLAPGGRLILTTPFGLHPFPDHKSTIYPRTLMQWLGDRLPLAGIEVIDGYIRLIAGGEGPHPDPEGLAERLLEITEAGACHAQERLHAALDEQRRQAADHADGARRLRQMTARSNQLSDALANSDAGKEQLARQIRTLTARLEELHATVGPRDDGVVIGKLADLSATIQRSEQALSQQMARTLQPVPALGHQIAELASAKAALEAQLTILRDAHDRQKDRLNAHAQGEQAAQRKADELASALAENERQLRLALTQLAELQPPRGQQLSDLDRLRRECDDLHLQVESGDNRLRQQRQQLDQSRQSLQEAQASLEQARGALRDSEARVRTLHELLETARAAVRAGSHLQASIALQLGNLLLSSRSPRGLMRLPGGLLALLREGRRRKNADPGSPDAEPRVVTRLDLPWEWTRHRQHLESRLPPGQPALPATDDTVRTRPPAPARKTGATSRHSGHGVALPDEVAQLRVAAIMDEFTAAIFAPDCHLRQLTPDGWHEELAAFQPHLLLVESAWNGHDGLWNKAVAQTSAALQKLVAWCRQNSIPTVFWNKEDPVHFRRFLPTARLFDIVFTTDCDRIGEYRRELGHDRVHLLAFAVQPREHNPVERYAREPGFCFAGSYYHKYPERMRDFAVLATALEELGPVVIYDRNHGKGEESLAFPSRYQPLIRGRLPFERIDKAYKGFECAININTVKQSQSMFARRVYELLASNTHIVSNYSRGMRLFFGDLVIHSDNDQQLRAQLRERLADKTRADRIKLAGLRKVMREHTCRDRLLRIVEISHGTRLPDGNPPVILPVRVRTRADVDIAMATLARQTYPHLTLVLVTDPQFGAMPPLGRDARVEVHTLAQARSLVLAEQWPDAHVAGFDPRDYYGPNYMTDLTLATRYSNATTIGRGSHYRRSAQGDLELVDEGRSYQDQQPLAARRAIIAANTLGATTLADWLDGQAEALVAARPGLSIDAFNYCENADASVASLVDDLPDLDTGLPYPDIESLARAAADPRLGFDRETEYRQPRVYQQQALADLFAAVEPDQTGRVKVTVIHSSRGVEIESSLAEGKHAYVYAKRAFPVGELTDNSNELRFNLDVRGRFHASVALVFLDAESNRLGHAFVSPGTNVTLPVTPGTASVRIGLRFVGPGTATISQLALGHLPTSLPPLVGRGDILVLAKDYPRYDNLYRYTFVHSRVRGYARAGVRADVFRFSNLPLQFDEFQNVDVTIGQATHLDQQIRGGHYRGIVVHALDRRAWECVKPWLSTIPVTVFIHGAEAQRWFRRSSLITSDTEIPGAIHRSKERMALWREVLGDLHPNLRLVFVSDYLARSLMNDLGVTIPPDRYRIIHNVIDPNLFPYRHKDPDKRFKVLSIRPFASPVYANDLSVRAIVDLAREPWFAQMEFRLVGSGPLFDATVEPLRGFDNVILQDQFLTQPEIADLHADYGIFLCPTRMDSQGVSRDEAMSSGLVPVTSNVAAIPEFVDETCAMLAPAEDWRALADGIRRLVEDADLFQRMSVAAAERVRRQSGPEQTIMRELQVIAGATDTGNPPRPAPACRHRVAVYGDVNLNIMDGSAVWAASLAQALAKVDGCQVDLYLKAPVKHTPLIEPLMQIDSVRVIEPDADALTPAQALAAIAECDGARPYQAVILRGADLCRLSAELGHFRGRQWTYLTDIPQRVEDVDPPWLETLAMIASHSRFLLCQTAPLGEHLATLLPAAADRIRLLPPMIPACRNTPAVTGHSGADTGPRLVYAGKFAPMWGSRELLDLFSALRRMHPEAQLHVFGDKIHSPPDDPSFRNDIRQRLQEGEGITWHRAVPREELARQLPTMTIGWAWRPGELEDHTLELSTKILEYGGNGVAPVLYGNAINRRVFGDDYPLFADSLSQAEQRIASALANPAILDTARRMAAAAAAHHTFAVVAEEHLQPMLESSRNENPFPG